MSIRTVSLMSVLLVSSWFSSSSSACSYPGDSCAHGLCMCNWNITSLNYNCACSGAQDESDSTDNNE